MSVTSSCCTMVMAEDGARSRRSWWLFWLDVGITLDGKLAKTPLADGMAGGKPMKLPPAVVVTVLNVCKCAGGTTLTNPNDCWSSSFLFSDIPWECTRNNPGMTKICTLLQWCDAVGLDEMKGIWPVKNRSNYPQMFSSGGPINLQWPHNRKTVKQQ